MIAVDTNVLVYASRVESPWHGAADRCLELLAESRVPWAIPWPCIHEFLSVMTHPRLFRPPTPLGIALEEVDAWFESPSLVLIGEAGGYWPTFRDLVGDTKTAGPRVHDARIAAICIHHGVDVLWTADRDFGRFTALRVENPLTSRGSGEVHERRARYRRRAR